MKTLLVIIDGAADLPDGEYRGLTPLQAAEIPVTDAVVSASVTGRLITSPDGHPPGSETAILSILGYGCRQPVKGRAWFEALGLGMKVAPDTTVWRCNIVKTSAAGQVADPMPQDVSRGEAERLIGSASVSAHVVSATYIGGFNGLVLTDNSYPMHAYPSPYDAMRNGTAARPFPELPSCLWLWSPSQAIELPLFPLKGAVIAATPLVKGIGTALGLKIVDVAGATGDCTTALEAKAEAAIRALDRDNMEFVMVHVEGADMAAHQGSFDLKKMFLEEIDHRLIAPLWQWVTKKDDVIMALLPDHVTSWRGRCHTADPVPLCIYAPMLGSDSVVSFDERSVVTGSLGTLPVGCLAGFIRSLLKRQKNVH